MTIEVVDWKGPYSEQHELHFFMQPPRRACAKDFVEPGFKFGLPDRIVLGSKWSTTLPAGKTMWAAVQWVDPGNIMETEGRGALALIVDASNDNEVQGRIYAWFRDDSKSMIVGAFTAKRCKVEPDH